MIHSEVTAAITDLTKEISLSFKDALSRTITELRNDLALRFDSIDNQVNETLTNISSTKRDLIAEINKSIEQTRNCHKVIKNSLSVLSENMKTNLKDSIDVILAQVQQTSDNLKKLTIEPKESNNPTKIKHVNQNPKETISEAIRESSERDLKRNNLIIFNLPEQKNTLDENAQFLQLCTSLKTTYDSEIKIRRIGQKNDSKIRPVIASFQTFTDKMTLLTKAKEIRQFSPDNNLSKVSIKPDLTKIQQLEEKALLEELKKRRNNGELVLIKHGKIVTRVESN